MGNRDRGDGIWGDGNTGGGNEKAEVKGAPSYHYFATETAEITAGATKKGVKTGATERGKSGPSCPLPLIQNSSAVSLGCNLESNLCSRAQGLRDYFEKLYNVLVPEHTQRTCSSEWPCINN